MSESLSGFHGKDKVTLPVYCKHLKTFTTEMWSCDVGVEAEERFDIEHITKKSVFYEIRSEVPAKKNPTMKEFVEMCINIIGG
jgi:hypothetical protein